MSPISNNECYYKKQEKKKTQTQREKGDVTMAKEITVMQPQAKECQELLAATKSLERGMEWIIPQSFQKEPTLPTP